MAEEKHVCVREKVEDVILGYLYIYNEMISFEFSLNSGFSHDLIAEGLDVLNDSGFITRQMEMDQCGRYCHQNLNKHLGFCSKGEEFLIVYGYMLKGNIKRYAYKDSEEIVSWFDWLKNIDRNSLAS
ncbi:hypothetical protein POM88_026858 [Heracleum sosnowskyi]|uniref:Uncharacterized protein n=1 Tax=Heracleum sosnowskyi TaxID=360622 RepID=A0AAD8I7W3_9APIA|nr:hypothetical protein POM88_026858 [Heracleum sosnowskyi]